MSLQREQRRGSRRASVCRPHFQASSSSPRCLAVRYAYAASTTCVRARRARTRSSRASASSTAWRRSPLDDDAAEVGDPPVRRDGPERSGLDAHRRGSCGHEQRRDHFAVDAGERDRRGRRRAPACRSRARPGRSRPCGSGCAPTGSSSSATSAGTNGVRSANCGRNAWVTTTHENKRAAPAHRRPREGLAVAVRQSSFGYHR